MRSIANVVVHVLTQYRWHSFAIKALGLVALIERHIVRCFYGVRVERGIVGLETATSQQAFEEFQDERSGLGLPDHQLT